MLSHLIALPLMNTLDNDFNLFEDAFNASWDYKLRGKDSFREYAHEIWGLEGMILGVKMDESIAGFISLYYNPQRKIWLAEYFAVELKRGVGFSKIILPSISYAFEALNTEVGVAIKGENKRAQAAVSNALGTKFPDTGDQTLFIVDLVPWTWGTRHHIADGIAAAIETIMYTYRRN